jgi:hypothetical protein
VLRRSYSRTAIACLAFAAIAVSTACTKHVLLGGGDSEGTQYVTRNGQLYFCEAKGGIKGVECRKLVE